MHCRVLKGGDSIKLYPACLIREFRGLKHAIDPKFVMTAFNSKWKYEDLAAVVRVPQTAQNLVISRCCFEENG